MVFPLEIKQAAMEADKLWLKLRVWFQDEAKFWRISIPRKCWSPRWYRPIVWRQIVREYTYAYWLVFPDNWELDSYILPRMNTPIMEIFLSRISKRHPDEYVLMVMDWASCHTAKNLKVPKNIKLLPLPPYSPQLNPVENLWDEMREKGFWNKVFNSMDAVEKQMMTTLNEMENDQARIKWIAWFEWILDAVTSI